jgi:glucarate dehydratase
LHAPFALRTIVEIETDEGISGVAETYGGDAPLAALEAARAQILGRDPFQLASLHQLMCGKDSGAGDSTQTWLVPGENPLDQNNRTFAAIEIACLDIVGKAVGKPLGLSVL